jgi:hypothetical protein
LPLAALFLENSMLEVSMVHWAAREEKLRALLNKHRASGEKALSDKALALLKVVFRRAQTIADRMWLAGGVS